MLALARSRIFWLVAVLVLVLGAGAVVLNNQANAKKAAAAKVAAAKAPKSPYVAIANGKADVEGGLIQVAARTAGVIREVDVQEGADVKKGQVLARLEDEQPRLQAQEAEAELRQAHAQIALMEVQISTAKREYDRLQGLVSRNFVARQAVDQAQDAIRGAQANLEAQNAAIATAQAKLSQARYNQELTIIRAPADGRIVRRYANPGAGASTLNVSNMFDLEPKADRIVRAEISESALPFVLIGQTVQLSAEADPTRIIPGRVLRRAAVFGARKLQSDDPTERTDERVVEVVVATDGAPFLIGQRVLVKFMRTQQQAQANTPAAG
ncbi:MAG TPA: efflux RND transporter periplasmic adaptor subunit [Phenylobacterium sp.]|jgi:HlyD family secretion protein|uniref:efflux RND transporter periplasmic adaptor subunit n=1 Tax=Phenylobacterium sp. TaxID=1871053 RepID=UPI002C82BE0C|nr:efflux RND transporter periplasmic adaptor subunit [Phenylobacterium sp.]HXA37844.1 efflux RND transporter periplasmic adaptor subunit [Phenylobacterium sp.]